MGGGEGPDPLDLPLVSAPAKRSFHPMLAAGLGAAGPQKLTVFFIVSIVTFGRNGGVSGIFPVSAHWVGGGRAGHSPGSNANV